MSRRTSFDEVSESGISSNGLHSRNTTDVKRPFSNLPSHYCPTTDDESTKHGDVSKTMREFSRKINRKGGFAFCASKVVIHMPAEQHRHIDYQRTYGTVIPPPEPCGIEEPTYQRDPTYQRIHATGAYQNNPPAYHDLKEHATNHRHVYTKVPSFNPNDISGTDREGNTSQSEAEHNQQIPRDSRMRGDDEKRRNEATGIYSTDRVQRKVKTTSGTYTTTSGFPVKHETPKRPELKHSKTATVLQSTYTKEKGSNGVDLSRRSSSVSDAVLTNRGERLLQRELVQNAVQKGSGILTINIEMPGRPDISRTYSAKFDLTEEEEEGSLIMTDEENLHALPTTDSERDVEETDQDGIALSNPTYDFNVNGGMVNDVTGPKDKGTGPMMCQLNAYMHALPSQIHDERTIAGHLKENGKNGIFQITDVFDSPTTRHMLFVFMDGDTSPFPITLDTKGKFLISPSKERHSCICKLVKFYKKNPLPNTDNQWRLTEEAKTKPISDEPALTEAFPQGTYVIQESPTSKVAPSKLQVVVNGRINNFPISRDKNGKFNIDASGQWFSCKCKLVNYYKRETLPLTKVNLTKSLTEQMADLQRKYTVTYFN